MNIKKIAYTIISIFAIPIYALGQFANLSDLQTPSAPGFQLLDISPSSIERPTNPKAVALSLLNLSNNGTSIPKNFAFEISPFWLYRPSGQTVDKYLGINKTSKKINISSGLYNKASLSLASVYNDTSQNRIKNTNYISFGGRTNIIVIHSKEQNESIKSALDKIADLSTQMVRPDGSTESDPNKILKLLAANEEYQKAIKIASNTKPIFQLDIAGAYSQAFLKNTYENRRFNRSGAWLTGTGSYQFKDDKSDNLDLIILARYMNDNVLVDSTNNTFEQHDALDFGAKLSYTNDRFTVSVEYINRHYLETINKNSEGKNTRSNRTVGLAKYKINDNIYLVAAYGKNFGDFNNLFTTVGLNFGFGGGSL